MIMKKTALLVATAYSLFFSGAFAANDLSAGLTISGNLNTVSDCKPLISQAVADLGQKAMKDLPYIGESSNASVLETAYFVDLSGKECTNTKIGLKFLGDADDETGQALQNTRNGDDAAKGIAVNIYDAQGSIITPNVSVNSVNEEVYHGHFPFHLSMAKSAAENVAAGNVQASLTVEMVRL